MLKRFPDVQLASIREQYELHEFVRSVVDLKPVGKGDYLGRCPFHTERTPSFRVNSKRYRCFGCGAKGDIIDWVCHNDKLTFPQAVYRLSQGVIQAPEIVEEKPKTYPVSEYDAVTAWSIMRTCENWYQGGACDMGCLIEAGIFNEHEVCRYNNYTKIPIRNSGGYITGFLGRRNDSITTEGPKYINPPTTAAFKGSRTLWGVEIGPVDTEELYVVEGVYDAMELQRRGLYAVALLGCHVSEEQWNYLEYLCKDRSLIFAFDGDKAGAAAILEAAKKAKDLATLVSFCLLPLGKDPDNYGGYFNDLPHYSAQAFFRQQDVMLEYMENTDSQDLLNTLAKPYVEDNCRAGYAHYNVVDWVIIAHPEHADEIVSARKAMLEDPTENNIKLFLKAWIKPCRDIRREHGQFKTKRS